MSYPRVLQQIPSLAVILSGSLCFSPAALGDPVDDGEYVPATAAEVRFIQEIVDRATTSTPPLDGWEKNINTYLGQRTVREDKPTLIFERHRNFPMTLSCRVDFRETTAIDKQEAANQKTSEQLEQEMMGALASGDTKKIQEIQLELMAMLQSQMTAATSGAPMQPGEDPKKFYVQVIVNGEGETIGNTYDHNVPGVTKAFRVEKGGDDFLKYKYYLGDWKVTEFDARNWRITDRDDQQTAANHLRALVALVTISGDRESVENYVANHLDLDGLNSLLD